MKQIEIFKAGKHTSAGGQTLSFGESDLDATVKAYDPALHEAPIVVGHPKDNGPAYGWVTGLSFSEGVLQADLGQVDPEFAEMVAAGRFKKRSASFYAPDAPNNPKPGVFYLRHVGFLGAQPPAVKGLKDVAFNDAEEGVVEFTDPYMLAGLFRRMREWMIGKFGSEDADNVIPNWMVQDLEAESRAQTEAGSPMPAFSEPGNGENAMMTPEQIAELQAKASQADALQAKLNELEGKQADFSEAEKRIAERERQILRTEIGGKVDALIAAGKVLPAQKDQMVDFAMSLDDGDTVVEFGEGEGKQTLSRRAFFLQHLDGLPKQVDFQERSRDDQTGKPTDLSDREVASRAIAFQEDQKSKGIVISTAQAVDAVRAGKAG